jgi:8-oxo-dGTP pyrophosphatase MutT (NUDIX family)
VNSSGDRVLLTHHKKLNLWLQLGGHADGECDILAVAKKEVEEESGLQDFIEVTCDIFDLDIHAIPERKGIPEHLHYDVRFAFRVTGSESFIVSDESHALAWVEISRVDEFTRDPSMIRMANKWMKRR